VTAPVPQVLAYFDLSGVSDGFWQLEDPVWGSLDGPGVLAGDLATDVTPQAFACSIQRGRSRALDEFQAGSTTLNFRNHDRVFDPTYTTGTYYGQILPGKRFDVVAGGVTIFSGVARDYQFSYEVGTLASTAAVSVVDALGVLGAKEFDAWTTSSQLPGARIQTVFDRSEIAFTGPRLLDAGVETLQADSVTWGSNVLNYLQLVARTDQGRLYAARDGVLVYRDRLHELNNDPIVAFTPAGSAYGTRYHGIGLELGATFLYNRVGVDREGGTLQTVEDTDAQEATGLGILPLNIGGLLLNTDARSLALAEYLLSIYTDPELRISEVMVKLEDDTISDYAKESILGLDFGDLIQVQFAPDGVNVDIDMYCLVEGIRHDIAPTTHHVTLSLSASSRRAFWQLEHPIFGSLDGPAVLAF